MRTIIEIEGMSCGHCVSAVRTALEEVSGARVLEVRVGEAELEVSEPSGLEARLADALEKEGYAFTGVRG